MKKLLIGILMLVLVALVPSVSALVTWDPALVPADIPLVEDTTPDPTLDLSTLITGTLGGPNPVTYNYYNILDSTKISNTVIDSSTGLFTFTLVANANGDVGGSVTFEVNDNGVVDQFTATVTIANDNADVPTSLGTNMPSSINEDETVTVTLSAVNPVGSVSDLTFTIVDQPDHGSLSVIDQVLDQVVYTPSADYYGPDSFSFKATNAEGDSVDDEVVDVTVNLLYDDAPVLPDLDDHALQEKLSMDTLVLLEASDPDGVSDTLTYSLEVVSAPDESTFDLVTHWNAATRTLSGWEPTKDDVGELVLKLVVVDSQDTLTTPSRDDEEFTLDVYPRYMCEDGEMGSHLLLTVEEPEHNDEFGPGDMIQIEVTVDNEYSDDKDVMVEVILYDLDDHKKLAEVVSDEENLDEDGEDGEEFTFKLELQVPLDSDEDYKGNYVLYVKAYEDNEEDEQCLSEMVELDLSRESHEVIIKSMTVSPSTLNPGQTVDVTLTVLNIGRKDEDGVTVKLRNDDLGWDFISSAKDLNAYDESGNGFVVTFRNLLVPLGTEAKTHDIDAYVVFDNGAKSTSYMDSPTFNVGSSSLKVEESSLLTTGAAVIDELTAEGETEEEKFPWSTVLWILGDIVLIIVAVFFLKLIFSGRRRVPEVKEVKL